MDPEAVFVALADTSRREVVEALARRGAATATELAAGMPITRQAVAKHLMHLHRKGMVVPERCGRETRYRLTTAPLADAVDWLEQVCGTARGRRAA